MVGNSNRPLRTLILTISALVIIVGGFALGLRGWYSHNLKPVSSSTAISYFTVERGVGVHQIAVDLQNSGLIRSSSAFETYVTTSDDRDKLQAGTYKLSPSMSVQTIVAKMVNGDVAKNLLTILPGKRLDQIKQSFREAGYSKKEVEVAFNPDRYRGLPVLASLPSGASLEGYLYPDSFQKQTDTPASTIVRESLDEMEKYLTDDIEAGFKAHGLSTFEGITLASIVLKETANPNDAPIVAQVLQTRLKRDMPLQSDVTAFYASDVAGVARSVNIDSAYNTYLHKGLPPGPISNVNEIVLRAVAHPATTSFLYFITGDNGKMYFSYTAEEHQTAIDKYCKKGCAQ